MELTTHYTDVIRTHYDKNIDQATIDGFLRVAAYLHRSRAESLEEFAAEFVATLIANLPMNECMPYSDEGMQLWYGTFNEMRCKDPDGLVETLRRETHKETARKLLTPPEPHNPLR